MYEFRICETPREIRETFSLRYDVYCEEKGWINPDLFPDKHESDEYDDSSVHIVAIKDDLIVGSARLILPSELGMPLYESIDFDSLGYDINRVAEISRFAVVKEERSQNREFFFGLSQRIWYYLTSRNYVYWGAIADRALFLMLKRLGMPFVYIGDPIWHVGSESIPLLVDLRETHDVIFKNGDITGGEDIEII